MEKHSQRIKRDTFYEYEIVRIPPVRKEFTALPGDVAMNNM